MTKQPIIDPAFDPLNELILHKNQIEQINRNVIEIARAHNDHATNLNEIVSQHNILAQQHKELVTQNADLVELVRSLADIVAKLSQKQ